MALRALRDNIVDSENPESHLKLADEYLQVMAQMGDNFLLPHEHGYIKPILEHYAGDLAGWVKFVRGVRDRLPKGGKQYHLGVQALLRTLVVRLTQSQRRERLDAAVEMALKKKLISNDYEEKMKYSRRCTQVWKVRRDRLLKAHASSAASGRLNADEREGILSDFWDTIVLEIKNGEVPKP